VRATGGANGSQKDPVEPFGLKTEEIYRKVVENAHDLICGTDVRGYLTFVSNAALEILGYEKEEIIGKHYLTLIREDYQREVNELYSSQLAKSIPNTYGEFPVLTKGGKEIWFGQNVQLVMEGEDVAGFQAIARDISVHRRIDEDRSMFYQAVEQSSSIVMITDTQGRIEYVNPRLTEITGYSKDELIGENPRILKSGATAEEEYRALWRTITSGGAWRGQFKNKKKNGESYWESAYISPIRNEQGFITHFLAIKEDITERRRSDEKLEEANSELEAINEQLEQAIERANRLAFAAEAANISKSEFLANMSHEIRTPLNGIIGMTELALDTELSAEQQEYLKVVKASADSLLTLINDILDFSKIEAKKLDLDSMDFDLRDTLVDTLKTLAFRAHEKSLELTCHVLHDVPEGLVGDPGRLRQIVVNLISNAIKFTDTGEVILQVEVGEQTGEDVFLHFVVTDTGIGIPPDKQQMIFEPFVQADGSATRKHSGTGLGLAICCHLVEMMGGKLWVQSETGKGSQFHFTACFGLQSPASSKPIADLVAEVRGLAVLAVDDNTTNRRVLEEMLTSWGMKPTLVESAQAAIRVIEEARAAGTSYPLVITDANMPEMDGFELAERIKKQLGRNSATIMMLTSAGMRGDAARCREVGVSAYLTKPIKHSCLLDAIQTALSMNVQEGGAPPLITRHSLRERRLTSFSARKGGLRILLAEDNIVNQKLVIRLFGKKGHTVDVVNDGKAVLEVLGKTPYDVVLMDLQMPEMDGLTATGAIREREKETGGHIPIIALTAHAMAGDKERCLKAGMDGYVAKPIRAEELFEAIEAAMAALPEEDESGASPGLRTGPGSEDEPGERILDRTGLMARVDGDKTLLAEIMALFREEGPELMSQIRKAVAEHKSEALHRAAHALKGSVGNLGGKAAYEAALRLEDMGRRDHLDQAEEAYAFLDKEFGRLNSALLDLLKEGED
jgi:two-component system sensor histidine kinase/response regulator